MGWRNSLWGPSYGGYPTAYVKSSQRPAGFVGNLDNLDRMLATESNEVGSIVVVARVDNVDDRLVVVFEVHDGRDARRDT